MKKAWLVLRNEFTNTVTRRSFILTLLLAPIIAFVVVVLTNVLGGKDNSLSQALTQPVKSISEGYVDENGLIRKVPASLQPGRLIAYTDRTQAEQALKNGEIKSYYVLPADYLEEGKIYKFQESFNPLAAFDNTEDFRLLLQYNLLGGDNQLAIKYETPSVVKEVNLAPEEQLQRDKGNMLTFFLPYIVTMLFYIIILGSSSLMLNSITIEKQNRVIEVLMASISPLQMLVGKITALGLVGLLQTIVWSGTGYLLLSLIGKNPDFSSFQLPVSILIWGSIYFILGYAIYASLMAAVGALVPNLREASSATTIIIIPVIIPLLLISSLINTPDGILALVLSLFPLTSPVSMMTRLSATSVPLWQNLLAVSLLLITAFLIIKSVAGMYRAQTLLSGQVFKFQLFIKALMGKV
jgi:ABC-2 type transport system permease protein